MIKAIDFSVRLMIVFILLITSPIWLLILWFKRSEPIQLKKHHIKRIQELREAKQRLQ